MSNIGLLLLDHCDFCDALFLTFTSLVEIEDIVMMNLRWAVLTPSCLKTFKAVLNKNKALEHMDTSLTIRRTKQLETSGNIDL